MEPPSTSWQGAVAWGRRATHQTPHAEHSRAVAEESRSASRDACQGALSTARETAHEASTTGRERPSERMSEGLTDAVGRPSEAARNTPTATLAKVPNTPPAEPPIAAVRARPRTPLGGLASRRRRASRQGPSQPIRGASDGGYSSPPGGPRKRSPDPLAGGPETTVSSTSADPPKRVGRRSPRASHRPARPPPRSLRDGS